MFGAVGEYNDKIQSGEIVACDKVKRAYANLVRDLEDGTRWTYDARRARAPISFIERLCRHSKGEWSGRKVRLELWQRAFIEAVYGTVDKATGLRRFTLAELCVARKNGKSFISCGLALYSVFEEPGAEVYFVATKLDQSQHSFDEVLNMVAQSPSLRKRLRKRRSDLYYEKGRAICKPLGSRSQSMDGTNSSLVVADELHAWKGQQGRELFEVMQQSMSARREPLLLVTTTSGTVRNGIYDDLYSLAEKTLDGEGVDNLFAVVYEQDSPDEMWDEVPEGMDYAPSWAKSNPNIGVSKKPSDLTAKVSLARAQDSARRGILNKDFNIPSTSSSAWLDLADLESAGDFDLEDFRGGDCVGGVDLSIVGDLTSACILMCRDGELFLHSMYWLPQDALDAHMESDGVPYDIWVRKGHIRVCPGARIRLSDVTAWFLEVVNEHGITPHVVGFDPYCSQYWVQEMQEEGFDLEPVRQGAKTLSAPLSMLEAEFKEHRVHYMSPVTKWCLSNAQVQEDSRNGSLVPTKNRNSGQRDDGFMSLLDAYVELDRHRHELDW